MSQNNEQQLTVQQQKILNLREALNQDFVQQQLKAALDDAASSFAGSLVELFTTDNNLQECDPKQVIMQALRAASLKLPINKNLGYAYILAFKGKPEFIIGYKGLIQLAIRSNAYEIINAGPVYEGEYKTANKLTGEFDLTGMATSDKVIGYFSYFRLKNGFSKTLFMTREKIEAHASKYSKSYNSNYSPWKTDFDQMATKTALRLNLNHWGYLSGELREALDAEDVSDKVQAEIEQHGNARPMNFERVPEAQMADPAPANSQRPPF